MVDLLVTAMLAKKDLGLTALVVRYTCEPKDVREIDIANGVTKPPVNFLTTLWDS